MNITDHARQRLSELMNTSDSTRQFQIAARALAYGVGYQDATGELRDHFPKMVRGNSVEYARIYGSIIFIFDAEENLLTVFRLLNEYAAYLRRQSPTKPTTTNLNLPVVAGGLVFMTGNSFLERHGYTLDRPHSQGFFLRLGELSKTQEYAIHRRIERVEVDQRRIRRKLYSTVVLEAAYRSYVPNTDTTVNYNEE